MTGRAPTPTAVVASRSGDWPGALMRTAAEPTLFFQGAVGDQSPVAPPDGRPETYARELAERVKGMCGLSADDRPCITAQRSKWRSKPPC